MPAIFRTNGLTVTQLKQLVADWPETDQDGEPTEVWMMTGFCVSNLVKSVVPLNVRGESCDMLLDPGDDVYAQPPIRKERFEWNMDPKPIRDAARKLNAGELEP